jgi:hypothetical protein
VKGELWLKASRSLAQADDDAAIDQQLGIGSAGLAVGAPRLRLER